MAALAKSQLLAFEQESGERRDDLRRLLNEAVINEAKDTASPEGGARRRQTVDDRMRRAHAQFARAFRRHAIPTTPAYDVVGLMAALGCCAHCFYETPDVVHPKLATTSTHLALRPEHRVPETLLDFATRIDGEETEFVPDNLLVLTDFGEECDDEVACLLAERARGVRVLLVFTTEHYEKQRATFEGFGGRNCAVVSVGDEASVAGFFRPGERNVLLQIGPVHGKQALDVGAADYDYYLLGTFGNTLNSKPKDGGPKEQRPWTTAVAKALHDGAARRFIVDTMRGKGAFKFRYPELRAVFGARHPIVRHVANIGWRNTVGRADPFVGRFVAHLVRAPEQDDPEGTREAGANYATVRAIVETLRQKSVPPVVSRVNAARVRHVASAYLMGLREKGARFNLALDVDRSGRVQNSIAGHSWRASRITDGYGYILSNLNRYFGVPVQFFKSGKPEHWEPMWDTPSARDRASAARLSQLFE